MIESRMREALAEAAGEVLETMFFTTVVGEGAAAPDGLAMSVIFSGEAYGCLTAGASPDAARALASSFLGDDEITPVQTEEVLGELANMICGSVLCRLWPSSRFELSHPVAAVYEGALVGDAGKCLDVGEGSLALALTLSV
jgi:hypothetical protein